MEAITMEAITMHAYIHLAERDQHRRLLRHGMCLDMKNATRHLQLDTCRLDHADTEPATIDMCADTCTGMCADTCTGMCADTAMADA